MKRSVVPWLDEPLADFVRHARDAARDAVGVHHDRHDASVPAQGEPDAGKPSNRRGCLG